MQTAEPTAAENWRGVRHTHRESCSRSAAKVLSEFYIISESSRIQVELSGRDSAELST